LPPEVLGIILESNAYPSLTTTLMDINVPFGEQNYETLLPGAT